MSKIVLLFGECSSCVQHTPYAFIHALPGVKRFGGSARPECRWRPVPGQVSFILWSVPARCVQSLHWAVTLTGVFQVTPAQPGELSICV